MKGPFHAAPRGTEKQRIIHCHWRDCRSGSTRLTGAAQDLLPIGRMKWQDSRQPCPRGTRAYQPEGHPNCQSPETIGPTPDAGLYDTLDAQT